MNNAAEELSHRMMFVSLNIGMVGATKTDRSKTREIAHDLGISEDVGRYIKRLFSEQDLAAISKIAGRARVFHDENTIPYIKGVSGIPTKAFIGYKRQIGVFQQEFNFEVAKFIERYDEILETSKRTLGPLFRESDYVPGSSLLRKFYFRLESLPFPIGEDYKRINLDASIMQDVVSAVEDRTNNMIESITTECFNRLTQVIKDVNEKLGVADKIFRDSLIWNIAEVVGMVRQFNVMNDPDIEKLADECTELLKKHTPDEIRQSKEARKEMVDESEALLQKLRAYSS